MAETIETSQENVMSNNKYATRGTGNAALTLGIIGTALGALGTGIGGLKGIAGVSSDSSSSNLTYLERKQCQDYLDLTKQFYEGQAATANGFFEAYKNNSETAFNLYKGQRDADDEIKAQMNSNLFSLYQMEQNDKWSLAEKINEVDRKVEVMAAIRPYQDALIDCKIDNTAANAAYELQKKTCRMLQGVTVLPSTNAITGFSSFPSFSSTSVSGTTA